MSTTADQGGLKGRIPVTLVTGFLGSGKTTLINTALRAPELANTVVVINEFGEVGLDHELVASSNDAVVVLENGCLCCTVRSDLVTTLNDLFRSRQAGRIPAFDNVVIETSGLAEPAPVLQAFLSEPTLDGLYRVANVVAMVDAVNWAETSAEHEEAVRQVALADYILVAKLDLVPIGAEAHLSDLREDLKRLNPIAPVQPVDWSTAEVAAILRRQSFDPADPKANPLPWLGVEAYLADSAHKHEHDHAHDRVHGHGHDHDHEAHMRGRGIESFVLIREEPLSREELQFLLDGIAQNLGPSLLRVKGLVNVAEEPGKPAVIQGAQQLLHTMTWLQAWPNDDRRTRVVFITQGIVREKLKNIIELLDRMSARTFKARERARQARFASRDE